MSASGTVYRLLTLSVSGDKTQQKVFHSTALGKPLRHLLANTDSKVPKSRSQAGFKHRQLL
jgi:hypothetical protein